MRSTLVPKSKKGKRAERATEPKEPETINVATIVGGETSFQDMGGLEGTGNLLVHKVRCYGCGRKIGTEKNIKTWNEFLASQEAKAYDIREDPKTAYSNKAADVMAKMGLERVCCRQHFLTPHIVSERPIVSGFMMNPSDTDVYAYEMDATSGLVDALTSKQAETTFKRQKDGFLDIPEINVKGRKTKTKDPVPEEASADDLLERMMIVQFARLGEEDEDSEFEEFSDDEELVLTTKAPSTLPRFDMTQKASGVIPEKRRK